MRIFLIAICWCPNSKKPKHNLLRPDCVCQLKTAQLPSDAVTPHEPNCHEWNYYAPTFLNPHMPSRGGSFFFLTAMVGWNLSLSCWNFDDCSSQIRIFGIIRLPRLSLFNFHGPRIEPEFRPLMMACILTTLASVEKLSGSVNIWFGKSTS